jgi:hypothetical protein
MGGLTIDFSEVENSFEPLPEDDYECIVENVEVRESKSSDNPYLNWELTVQNEEYEGRKIWLGASLSPKALFTLEEMLVNLGVIEPDEKIELEWDDEVDITPSEGPQLTYPEVIGMACVVHTVNRVYEGKERQDAWRSSLVGGPEGRTVQSSSGDEEGGEEETERPAKKAGKAKKAPAGKKRQRKLR